MKRLFYPICFLLVFNLSCSKQRISKSDIKHAQNIFGMEFTPSQIATMQDYLNSNLRGYDSLRTSPPGFDVIPAMTFDPFPMGYELSDKESDFQFEFNSDLQIPDDKSELAFYSVADLSVLIKTKQITSLELTEFFLERIREHDPKLQAVITITEDRALDRARLMDNELAEGKYRGPLHGIPYGAKDLLAVKDYPTTWGSEAYKDQYLDENATVIEKLDEAGAVLVAKLVSGSLARGDVWFGGKTKNPWDLKQGASGSSAGSGSATAAGLVPFAIGTETLGSITSPSNRNGITGLRPTYGRVSRYGAMTLSWSMDKIGPMCRSAEDCALVFEAMYGKDPNDMMTIQAPFSYNNSKDGKPMRVGYFKEFFEADSSSSRENNLNMLEEIKALGYTLEEVKLPKATYPRAFDVILRAEAGAFFDELVLSGKSGVLVEQDRGSRANSLRQSRFIPAVEYLQANRHRRMLMESFDDCISDFDVILSPTSNFRQLITTNLTGHPVLAIPTGLDSLNHPTSISLIGNLFDEENILELGTLIQSQTEFHKKTPPGFE